MDEDTGFPTFPAFERVQDSSIDIFSQGKEWALYRRRGATPGTLAANDLLRWTMFLSNPQVVTAVSTVLANNRAPHVVICGENPLEIDSQEFCVLHSEPRVDQVSDSSEQISEPAKSPSEGGH